MQDQNLDIFKEIFSSNKEYLGNIIEQHINKLRELDKYLPPSQSFFIVTNTSKQNYEFVSKNFEYALGHDRIKMTEIGVPYWFSKFHPEDLPIWLKLLEDLMIFTMTEIDVAERERICYTWNFRVENNSGKYFNITEHQSPTYFDEQGKPIIGIAHSSITGNGKKRPIIGIAKLLNENDEYETIYYKNYSQKLLTASLTHRELDIVRLLSLNYSSKEIGHKLFISLQTVGTHRKNILRKLDFNSTQELVQYCIVNQLF